uniref:Calponin-homology (CH) domain-containing protein n=1 Tax=Macrostomum lignano TaxID=282301 RepID=A0A1I8FUU5_9PLAT
WLQLQYTGDLASRDPKPFLLNPTLVRPPAQPARKPWAVMFTSLLLQRLAEARRDEVYRSASMDGRVGMASEKLDGKRDPGQEAEVLDWIEAIIGEKLERDKGYENILQNGIVLCKLMNKIKPGSVKKINEANSMPFKIMENINAFQNAIKAYGVPTTDVFQTVDLYEKKDISQVTQCLFALGRTCQVHPEFTGPVLGPKLSEENKREFSEDQMNASKSVIGLQAGFNKGASQAGMNFGKGRMIVD